MSKIYRSIAIFITAVIHLTVASPVAAQAVITQPQIFSITPSTATPGTRIELQGDGFVGYNEVHITGPNGATVVSAPAALSTQLVFYAPYNLPGGTYSITVLSNGRPSNSVPLTLVGTTTPPPGPQPTIPPGGTPGPTIPPTTPPTQPTGPVIHALSPQTVSAGGRVEVQGDGFAGYNEIYFQGPVSTAVSAPSSLPTQLVFYAPYSLTSGQYTVTIVTRGVSSNPVPLTVVNNQPPQTCILPGGLLCFPTPSPTTPPTTPPPGQPPQDCTFFGLICPPQNRYVYTILGDSVAAGLVAFEGYASQYEDYIENDNNVSIDSQNRAQSGARSADLRIALQQNTALRQDVAEADFVTWNIGGNDLRAARDLYKAGSCGGPDNQACLRTAVAEFKQNWNQIVQEVTSLKKPTAVVRSMDIYYPYVDEDRSADTWPNDGGQNDYDELRPYLTEVNQHIASSLQSRSIPYARVYDAFNGNGAVDPDEQGLIGFDGYHPNQTGHNRIASLLRQLGYGSFTNTQTAAQVQSQSPQTRATISAEQQSSAPNGRVEAERNLRIQTTP